MHINCEHAQTYGFTPSTAVLLCVDFQLDFLSPQGFCAAQGLPVNDLRRAVMPAGRVLSGARRAGITIVHTRECYAADLSDLNDFRRIRDPVIGARGPLGRFLIRGEAGTQHIPELAPHPTELVVDKAGFNAFYRTRLDQLLRERGISHLLIMGVTTQCCVASTVRGAVDCGYFPLLVEDCCAAWDPKDHEATVRVIFSENHQFGWVSDSARVLEGLERG